MRLIHFKPLIVFVLTMGIWSCTKKVDSGPGSFLISAASIDLTSTNLIPSDSVSKAHAYALLNVMGDSMLNYDVYFLSLPTGDAPTSIALYNGNPSQAGALLLQFENVTFNSQNESIGKFRVAKGAIDSLNSHAQLYLVVNSSKKTSGLVRGQVAASLTSMVQFATDVNLIGSNVVPAVSTLATGNAVVRLLADNSSFYSTLSVANLPANDTLVSAAVRKTVGDAVVLQLASSAADFGVSKMQTVSVGTSLQTDSLYIDVRSKRYPNGLLRGKIR